MRKNICIVLFLLLASPFCFAVTQPVRSKELPVVGVVGKVHSTSIVPILGAAPGAVEGMPFNILGADVSNDLRPEAGRRIATWSLLTNYYPTTLTVTVSPLRGVVTQETLNYMLYVKYLYSCIGSGGGILTVDDALIVETFDGNSGSASVRLSVPADSIPDSFISIINSPIRFKFTDSPEALEQVTDDEYLGTVTFTVMSD